MTDSTTVVAVVGLGRMRGAMARPFHDGGNDLVLWNRNRAKAKERPVVRSWIWRRGEIRSR